MMENALEKARMGGYEKESINANDHLMSPLFWQALGKRQGWEEFTTYQVGHNGEANQTRLTWIFQWYNFIDHIADGKSIDSFFEELLK